MRRLTALLAALAFCSVAFRAPAQSAGAKAESGPNDPKAKKTFAEGLDFMKREQAGWALDAFRKANKQDGGQCGLCEKQAILAALAMNNFKAAAECGDALLSQAQSPVEKSYAYYWQGLVLLREGMARQNEKILQDADQAFRAAIAADPSTGIPYYGDEMALANLKQDDAAREQFRQFLKTSTGVSGVDIQRAGRYIQRPELARARMAPPFAVTTIDGKRVSLDDLAGKVVLIDFWATWCGPCREALPRVKAIAHEFEGQPFVALSVSLDSDQQKWSDFVAKNEMTWMQARDGGFTGSLSRLYNVNAIPHTFTIDSDGVLQDEHVGDANIEGRIKKLIARAAQPQLPLQTAAAHQPSITPAIAR